MSRLCGIFGRPYLDLSGFVDTTCFPELDDEITRGLCHVETTYTGATLKWMGVVAPWQMDDGYVDAMHAIERMSTDELARFVALGDAAPLEPTESRAFGDETDRPLSRAQMLHLKYRHGVYFPWKVCYHLVENDRWEDKHSGEGKDFTEEARRWFPRTVAFVEGLPFREIGRCVLFGLEANDHAPFHRDAEPGRELAIAQSISFAPRPGKRLVLRDADGGSRTLVDAPIHWFNDMDYHGVEPDPYFRYSIRVDGVFERDFLRALRARYA